MRGIVLAGGTGSRLWPITQVVSKQLLPVYDKPMIYYPISLLMAAGIREFTIISTPRDLALFQALLGDGSRWGVNFKVVEQDQPRGLPDAFNLVSQDELNSGSILILGDNLFYGSQIAKKVFELLEIPGAAIFGYLVNEVNAYGSLQFDPSGKLTGLAEKAEKGRGYAIPGIYKFDAAVRDFAALLKPSARGELEITDLLKCYLAQSNLDFRILDRGTAWLDTGTVENLNQAAELIRVIQSRQGMLIGSPEEVAFRNKWISEQEFAKLAKGYGESEYAKSLLNVLREK
jgi:glucose-1-phosphate thymidylyltransferase